MIQQVTRKIHVRQLIYATYLKDFDLSEDSLRKDIGITKKWSNQSIGNTWWKKTNNRKLRSCNFMLYTCLLIGSVLILQGLVLLILSHLSCL